MRVWRGLVVMVVAGILAGRALATEIVNGPVIGHVTDGSARIWMQVNMADRVTVHAVDVTTGRTVASISLDVEGPSPFICDAPVPNLDANRNYRIEILFDNKPVKLVEPLIVRTAPPRGEVATFEVAFASGVDVGMEGHNPLPVAKAVAAYNPRAMLFLGNTGMLPEKEEDFPKTRKEAFRFLCKAQQTVRGAVGLQTLFHGTPIYGTWGERDFGPMDSNREFVYSQENLIAFEKFWPNPDYGVPEAPGMYCNFTLGDVDFFVVDTRSLRAPPTTAGAGKEMLGKVQMDWLKKQMKESRATLKVIASSAPMLADDASVDGWWKYKEERAEFLEFLAASHISGVVFVSGGGACGELVTRKPAKGTGYPLHEIISSPLAGKVLNVASANALRVGDAVLVENFGTLEFGGGSKAKRFVTLQLRDAKGKVVAEETVFAGNLVAE